MAESSEAPLRRLRRAAVSILAVLAIAGWAPVAAADPDALWTIVHGQCVPDQRNHDDPAPCALVDLDGGPTPPALVAEAARISRIMSPARRRPR